jgi:2-amino-4-hydroxy-6-hydroxymethyldihydropteridine diphosphokinase
VASTDAAVRAAAQGVLPPWAEVTPTRRAHIERVTALMLRWADSLGLDAAERDRWAAAARLHDALRDAEPKRLRALLSGAERDLPDPLLHGPAVAVRLRGADPELRDAVRFHTTGSSRFGVLGRALYLADFLEPGRDFATEWRAGLRERMPHEMDAVLVEVLEARIAHLLETHKHVRPETIEFWNSLVGAATGEDE